MSRLPSVTEVLKPWTDFSAINPEVLERACVRGSDVHALAALYAQKLWVHDVPEEYAGYFRSFIHWFDKHVVAVHLVEKRIVDPIIGFHGQLDLLLTIRGDPGPSLWDIKTGTAPQKTWPIQIGSYAHLARLKGFEVCRRGTIIPDKHGKDAKLIEYTGDLREDFNIFLSALNCWRYFHA